MFETIAVIAIILFVIGRQFIGESIRGKRLIVLPAVLTVIGIADLSGHHAGALDIVFIAASAAVAVAIGLCQGLAMRLRKRDGHLWGQMPLWALGLWAALLASHGLLDVAASAGGAHLAASTTPLLLTLGANRLAQALVIAPRAYLAGIPFAPEKDGSTFLASLVDPR